MTQSNSWFKVRLALVSLATLAVLVPAARAQKPKEPTWLHGLEMAVRKAGEETFTKETKKWGVEAFKDENTGCLIYITENGTLTVLNPTGALKTTPPNEKPKSPLWLHGLGLKARKAGEVDFGKDTKKYGMEVFKDENTGALIYIAETGAIHALTTAAAVQPGAKSKEPEWLYAFEVQVRKAVEENFTKDTKKRGLEAFRDDNTGCLVYITETGSISALSLPTAPTKPTKIKESVWLNGLELKVRKAGEVEWTNAKKYGSEDFKDENVNTVFYVSELGGITAVLPAVAVKFEQKTKPPEWKHGLELKVRPAGESDWAKAKKFGIEVFKDDNTGCYIYICENGEFASVVAK